MQNVNKNYYEFDKENIAKTLQKALDQNADPLVIDYLNNERKEKIKNAGGALAQYQNDSLTKVADDYVDLYRKENVSKLHEARRNNQAANLKAAHAAARGAYETAAGDVAKDFSNARRLYIADAKKESIDTENALARLGLGRGITKPASSGFGESARVKLLTDSAEGLAKLYSDEQKAKENLAGQMQTAISKANETYMENIDESYKDQADDEISENKNFKDNRMELLKLNQSSKEGDRDFALKAKELAYEIASGDREFLSKQEKEAFDMAYSVFEAVGQVVTKQMADILGVPVGTKYWKHVVDLIRANASATSASASYKDALTNESYKNKTAETDRMLAESELETEEKEREYKYSWYE